MYIACFHIVVTPLVCINQEWWMLEHQMSVIEQLVHTLWQCLSLWFQHGIIICDYVALLFSGVAQTRWAGEGWHGIRPYLSQL